VEANGKRSKLSESLKDIVTPSKARNNISQPVSHGRDRGMREIFMREILPRLLPTTAYRHRLLSIEIGWRTLRPPLSSHAFFS
jgi:hypothetical protein